MTDLRTRYLGLELRAPVVASASPLTGEPDMARRLEDAGVGAIVLPSLFEEEILREEIGLNTAIEAGSEHFAEALEYFPPVDALATAGDRYVRRLGEIKTRTSVPVVASLNATTPGGWARYATRLGEAGADAIELNLYHVAANPDRSAADVEARDLEVVASVRAAIDLPLAVKLGPWYSAMANFAGRSVAAGADGLVLFNRFYQPDIDLDSLDVVPRVELSEPADLRLPLRWIAILHAQLADTVSLAASSGIHAGSDVAKALVVGADVAMMTSALLRHGPEHVATVEAELRAWMADREYESVAELRGSASHATAADPSAFERANYLKTLHSWTAPPERYPTAPSQ
jgi:dihydroorotate dehydrogenase (fumarate)